MAPGVKVAFSGLEDGVKVAVGRRDVGLGVEEREDADAGRGSPGLS